MTPKFNIYFFRTSSGHEPVREYLVELKNSKNEQDQKLLETINTYLRMLSKEGSMLGVPYVKNLYKDIWELRPKKQRILYCCIQGNNIYLLHHFTKKTQKTPKKELDIAKRRYKLLIQST